MCLGIPGRIVKITSEPENLAVVDVAGVRRTVNISCIVDEQHPPQACLGEWALVHVGFAMSRIDPEEAQRTIALLAELGEAQTDVQATRASGAK
jgi:hydrogenase expression/formation protein HypC